MISIKPKLRFPEFSDNWIQNKLGDISDKIGSGNTPSGGEKVYQKSGIIFIRSQNVNENQLKLDDVTFISEEINSKMKGSLVQSNDILLNITGASLGRSCVVPNNFIVGNVNQHVCIIRLNSNNNSRFIQSFLSSSGGEKLIEAGQTGSGREGLNFQSIRGFNIFTPTLPEQTKIAKFLTAVDDKIQTLKEKKRLWEEYKKGLMQNIFSQEIRFKQDDGSDFPDWEQKSLGEICSNVMYGMNSAAIEYDGINKYLRITDIDENSRRFSPNPLTSPDGEIEAKYKLKEGDLVFARTGASVGKSYLYKKEDGNLLFAGFLIKFSVINHNPYFVYCQTLQTPFNKWVKLMSMRSGQPGINAEEYKTFLIQLPCIQEQQKIANFLTTLDEKIEKVGRLVLEAQTFKKGLLQQMFV